MTQEADELLKKALALPIKDRAALAGALLESLDNEVVDPEVEEAWDEVIARRLAEIDSGKVKTIPWEDIRRETLAKFKRDHK